MKFSVSIMMVYLTLRKLTILVQKGQTATMSIFPLLREQSNFSVGLDSWSPRDEAWMQDFLKIGFTLLTNKAWGNKMRANSACQTAQGKILAHAQEFFCHGS